MYGGDIPLPAQPDQTEPLQVAPGLHDLLVSEATAEGRFLLHSNTDLTRYEVQKFELREDIDSRTRAYVNLFREHVPTDPNAFQRLHPFERWPETLNDITYNYSVKYHPDTRLLDEVEISMTHPRDPQDKELATFSPVLYMKFGDNHKLNVIGLKWQCQTPAIWEKLKGTKAEELIDNTVGLTDENNDRVAQFEIDLTKAKPTVILTKHYKYYGQNIFTLMNKHGVGKISADCSYSYQEVPNAFFLDPNPKPRSKFTTETAPPNPKKSFSSSDLPILVTNILHLLPLKDPFQQNQ